MSAPPMDKQITAKTPDRANETTVFVSPDGVIKTVRFQLRGYPSMIVLTDHIDSDFVAGGIQDELVSGKYRCVTTHGAGGA